MEMRNQAALIIRKDKTGSINDTARDYLIIRTDKNHLKDIANTLEFLED
jgi:hypothetical protein